MFTFSSIDLICSLILSASYWRCYLFCRRRYGCCFSWLNTFEDSIMSCTCLPSFCFPSLISFSLIYIMDWTLTPGLIFKAFNFDSTMSLMRLCTLGVCTKSPARFEEASLFIELEEFLSEWTFDDSTLLLESVFSSFTFFSWFMNSSSKVWRFSLLNCSRDFFGEFLGVWDTLRCNWSSAADCRQKAGVTWPASCCLLSDVAISSIIAFSSSLGTLAFWIWTGLSIILSSDKLYWVLVDCKVSFPKDWNDFCLETLSSSDVERFLISSSSLSLF